MMCCQFIFKPGTYDADFHHLDGEIDQFARSLPGFPTSGKCRALQGRLAHSAPAHWIHHLEIGSLSDLDDEVAGWLHEAADRAG